MTRQANSDTDHLVPRDERASRAAVGPEDLREPVPAERVRALPLVSVALGAMALGFCLVYFVCKPGDLDRAAHSRPIAEASDAAASETGAVVHGAAGDLRTDVEAGAAAPTPPPERPEGGTAAEAGAPPPDPEPDLPPPASPAGLTVSRIEVRKCADADGLEIDRDRCGKVRGVELFMARREATTLRCLESAFVAADRPRSIAVTLDVDFTNSSRRVTVPGADEARARQYAAFRDCLERELGQPEYARIDHPLAFYRYVFIYDYAP